MAKIIDTLNPYTPVVLDEEQQAAVKPSVIDWMNAEIDGMTDDQKRRALPQLRKYKTQCVAYVMANLPDGVDRVDGPSIKPILNQCIDEAINALPPVEEPEP